MLRILIVLLILGAAGYWYWTTTPEYSMEQVKEAVKHHDLVTFQKYVDMDSVASGIVDDLLAAPMRHLLGPGILGQWVVAGIVGILKQPLADGIKEELRQFVLTGELVRPDEDATPNSESTLNQPPLSLGVIDRHVGFRKHAFRRIEYDLKKGNVCTLGVLFHNQVYNRDLVLDVTMQESGGYWRVIGLSNFPAFTAKLIELQNTSPESAPSTDGHKPAEQL